MFTCTGMWRTEDIFGCPSSGYCPLYSPTSCRVVLIGWRGNPKTVLACLCLSRVGISRISLQQPCFFVGSGVPNQVLVFMWQGIFWLSYMPSSRESLFDRVPRNYTVTAPGYTDREEFPPLLRSTVDNVCCAWWRDTLQEWEDCVCPTEEHEPHMGMGNLKRGE